MSWYKIILSMAARTSPDIEKAIISLYKSRRNQKGITEGALMREIASAIGVSKQTVERVLHRSNLRNINWSRWDIDVSNRPKIRKKQEKAKKLYEQGLEAAEIANILKMDRGAVARYIRNWYRKPSWNIKDPQDLQNKVIEFYNTRTKTGRYRSQKEIADMFGISLGQVTTILRENNISRNQDQKADIMRRNISRHWYGPVDAMVAYLENRPESEWLPAVREWIQESMANGGLLSDVNTAAKSILQELQETKVTNSTQVGQKTESAYA